MFYKKFVGKVLNFKIIIKLKNIVDKLKYLMWLIIVLGGFNGGGYF